MEPEHMCDRWSEMQTLTRMLIPEPQNSELPRARKLEGQSLILDRKYRLLYTHAQIAD